MNFVFRVFVFLCFFVFRVYRFGPKKQSLARRDLIVPSSPGRAPGEAERPGLMWHHWSGKSQRKSPNSMVYSWEKHQWLEFQVPAANPTVCELEDGPFNSMNHFSTW